MPATGRHELTGSQTHRLLALVATARDDAAAHRAKAVFSTLSEFTSYVHSLRASGSIDQAFAVKLLLKARVTESQTAAQLRTSPASTTAEVDATRTVTAAATPQKTTPDNPGTQAPTAGPTGTKRRPRQPTWHAVWQTTGHRSDCRGRHNCVVASGSSRR